MLLKIGYKVAPWGRLTSWTFDVLLAVLATTQGRILLAQSQRQP